MGNLSAFLAENALKVENIKHIVSKRFVDEDKKPIEWEIACITSSEDEALRKDCTKRRKTNGLSWPAFPPIFTAFSRS